MDPSREILLSNGSQNPVDPALASQYALRVALQTMKERCITLQQRLSTVEEENFSLRALRNNNTSADLQSLAKSSLRQTEQNEMDRLRDQNAELKRQKFQLTEHIAMVATENRQLWSRLSELTREKGKQSKLELITSTGESSSAGQNLIRSKTFTQHSPNPLLRLRNISIEDENTPPKASASEDLSLEEISLKALNDLIAATGEMEKRTEEMLAVGSSMGFGYLNDEGVLTATNGDLTFEARTCSEGVQSTKRDLLKQQSDLKIILDSMKQRPATKECEDCKLHNNKPGMSDKSLETDVIGPIEENFAVGGTQEDEESQSYINFLEEKRQADIIDKTCPMCGSTLLNSTIEEFHGHVEAHFIDASDSDSDKYEFVSNTVSNF